MALSSFIKRYAASIPTNQAVRTITVANAAGSYRMKIPLPTHHDTWFSFDETNTVEQCLDTMVDEDSHIHEISIDVEKSKTLNEIFATATKYDFKINGINYLMEYETMKEHKQDLNFSKKPLDDLIPLLLQYNPKNKKELDTAFNFALPTLSDQGYFEYLRLQSELEDILAELAPLEEIYKKTQKVVRKKSNIYCGAMLAALVGQWGLFYHCIFNVEFLGWDLMEPMTYSLGQGTFVAWVIYQTLTKNQTNYADFLQRFEEKKFQKLAFHKFGVDIERLTLLRKEKEKKEEEMKELKELSAEFYDFN